MTVVPTRTFYILTCQNWADRKTNTHRWFSLLEIFIQYKEHDCDGCNSRAHWSKSTKINNLNTKCQTAVSPLYFQIVFFSLLFTHTQLLEVCRYHSAVMFLQADAQAAGGGRGNWPIRLQLTCRELRLREDRGVYFLTITKQLFCIL